MTIRLLVVAVGLMSFTAAASEALLSLHWSACRSPHEDCDRRSEEVPHSGHRHEYCRICLVLKGLSEKCLLQTVETTGPSNAPTFVGDSAASTVILPSVPTPLIPRAPPAA